MKFSVFEFPQYLQDKTYDYIEKKGQPSVHDHTTLTEIGQYFINVKREHERDNSVKRLSNSLEFTELASILLTMFDFKLIYTSQNTKNGVALLGLYQNDGPDKGIYTIREQDIYRFFNAIAINFDTRQLTELYNKITRTAPTADLNRSTNLVCVNNGVFDQKTKELLPFSPDYIFTTKIPIDYKDNPVNPIITMPDGETWDVVSWIADLAVDEQVEQLLWEVIADALQANRSLGKSVWLYSEKGNNGKGTFGQLIKNILGVGNYSSLSVADFKDQFAKAGLLDTAANIADENDVDIYIDSVKDYKASITGDDITIDRKHKAIVSLQYTGANIQMMNGLPKIKDKTDSFYRRLIIVPFLKSFTDNGERTYIKQAYIHRTDVLEYVLHRAIGMYVTEYTTPDVSKDLQVDYKENNDSVLQFWLEMRDQFTWDLLPSQFLYDLFKSWYKDTNPSGSVLGKTSFINDLKFIVEDDDEWENKFGQNDKVRTGDRMDAPEPLVVTYGLEKWQRRNYTQQNDRLRATLLPEQIAKVYRGALRKDNNP